ncbi:MAG: hypothetical protein BMS9Abin07_2225 [Acidimicrobiia bacterium]|nr:MAG: hypothetical protein BMS9Abin07_2225 [Acidimicrobiia bacterium]
MGIVNQIQDQFSAGIVYGDPVETDGAVVVPAARVFGGGGGGSDPNLGEGGGFGLVAIPSGAWVIRNGQARWKPAIDVNAIVLGGQLVGISYFFFSWLIARARAKR